MTDERRRALAQGYPAIGPYRISRCAALLLLLTACSLSANQAHAALTPTLPAAPAAPLTVAWAENGDLMTWTSANPTPRRIASGGVIRPFLAPDGAQVAYLRGPEGQAFSLWISDTPGSTERQLLDTAALTNGLRRVTSRKSSGHPIPARSISIRRWARAWRRARQTTCGASIAERHDRAAVGRRRRRPDFF